MYVFVYFVIDDWHVQHQFDERLVDGREHLFLNYFFYHKRHGHNDVGLDVGKCLGDNLWRRRAVEEKDVHPDAEFVDKFEHQAIHVRHRQHRDYFLVGLGT